MFNNLRPQNVVLPQLPPRQINNQGLNIPASQHTSIPSGLKHETVLSLQLLNLRGVHILYLTLKKKHYPFIISLYNLMYQH